MVYVWTLDLEAGSNDAPPRLFSFRLWLSSHRHGTGFVLVVGESRAITRWILFPKAKMLGVVVDVDVAGWGIQCKQLTSALGIWSCAGRVNWWPGRLEIQGPPPTTDCVTVDLDHGWLVRPSLIL